MQGHKAVIKHLTVIKLYDFSRINVNFMIQ